MYGKGKGELVKNKGAKIKPSPVDIMPRVILLTLAQEHMGLAQLVVIPGANPSTNP